jgi:hypothetical protein
MIPRRSIVFSSTLDQPDIAKYCLRIVRWASMRSHRRDAPQVVQTTPTDKWHMTEEQSPMDDSKTAVLDLDSDDGLREPKTIVEVLGRCSIAVRSALRKHLRQQ